MRRRGALGPLEPYDDVQVSEETAMVLIDTDDIWTTDDGFVGATSAMLDGTSFSHEVTAAELGARSVCLSGKTTRIERKFLYRALAFSSTRTAHALTSATTSANYSGAGFAAADDPTRKSEVRRSNGQSLFSHTRPLFNEVHQVPRGDRPQSH